MCDGRPLLANLLFSLQTSPSIAIQHHLQQHDAPPDRAAAPAAEQPAAPPHWLDHLAQLPPGEARALRAYFPLLDRINSLGPGLAGLSDEELLARAAALQRRVRSSAVAAAATRPGGPAFAAATSTTACRSGRTAGAGGAWADPAAEAAAAVAAADQLEDGAVAEGFALVREAAWRVLGLRPYDVQLVREPGLGGHTQRHVQAPDVAPVAACGRAAAAGLAPATAGPQAPGSNCSAAHARRPHNPTTPTTTHTSWAALHCWMGKSRRWPPARARRAGLCAPPAALLPGPSRALPHAAAGAARAALPCPAAPRAHRAGPTADARGRCARFHAGVVRQGCAPDHG